MSCADVVAFACVIEIGLLKDCLRSDGYAYPIGSDGYAYLVIVIMGADGYAYPGVSKSKAPLFLWAEVVATAYLKYLHVFGALCYATKDSEDFGKLKPKADIESSFEESSSTDVIPSNLHHANQPFDQVKKWTKDHSLENVIRNPSRPVSTRHQLQTDDMWCYFQAFLTKVEPENYKEAIKESRWIEAMQEEIHEFDQL
ncbi:hypothetical protein Tco_1044737 [Tanacetum coccineum]|uniref:Integrase, catalytic region, zinc finger, CCHC-type, peptidase aspartic, catalytic n=1 Tax=Tanacetum coccineum TaxID=301880 RepID=A0ABQ5GSQ8_9ASTR